jgi:serine/arginine repetitive matrix protein 1
MDAVRNRERIDRRGGGRGDSWRGSRGDRGDRGFDRGGRDGGRDFDHRGHRRSRSPPPRRRDSRDRGFRGLPASREADTYVPDNRGGCRRDEPRRRSPSATSPARPPMSRSPTPRRRRLATESQSPPRQRRRSVSRSPSPDRTRRHYWGRGGRAGRGRSSDRNIRRRSYTPSNVSRSLSPKPRKRRRSLTRSPILSPPPRQRRRGHRNSSSRSRSRSSKASSQRLSSDEMDIIRAGNDRKGREHDERRLTRSNSGDRSITPPRRRRRSPSRSRSRSPGGRDQKRRRSIERYAPERRRRNTSSVSSPTDTRYKRADVSEDDDIRRSPIRDAGSKSPVRDRDLRRATELEEVGSDS